MAGFLKGILVGLASFGLGLVVMAVVLPPEPRMGADVPPVAQSPEPEAPEPEAPEPEAPEPEAPEPEAPEPEAPVASVAQTQDPAPVEAPLTPAPMADPARESATVPDPALAGTQVEPASAAPGAAVAPAEPGATEIGAGEAAMPEVTEPEAPQPEATEPEAPEPEATEPEATEPEATDLALAPEAPSTPLAEALPSGEAAPASGLFRPAEVAAAPSGTMEDDAPPLQAALPDTAEPSEATPQAAAATPPVAASVAPATEMPAEMPAEMSAETAAALPAQRPAEILAEIPPAQDPAQDSAEDTAQDPAQDTVQDTEPRILRAVPSTLLDRQVEGVVTGRLPSIGAEPAPEAADPAPDQADLPALARFAAEFDSSADLPRLSVLLVDAPGAEEALVALPFVLTIALDPDLPDAFERAARYRAAGHEVALLATGLPRGATASDLEITFSEWRRILPEAVALIDAPDGSGLTGDRRLAQAVMPYLAEPGLGLLTPDIGLNQAAQVAQAAGVAQASIFRRIDANDEDEALIRRFLTRAAFEAQTQGQAVVLGRAEHAPTLAALLGWRLEMRARQVSLAPVSALMIAGAAD